MPDAGDQYRPDPASAASERTFVASINQLRQLAGHTFRGLGRQTQVPPSTLHDTLTGRRRPSPEVIEAVTRAYAVDDVQAKQWLDHWHSLNAIPLGAGPMGAGPMGAGPIDAGPMRPGPIGAGEGTASPVPQRSRDAVAMDVAATVAMADRGEQPRPTAPAARGLSGAWRPSQVATVAVLMIASAAAGTVAGSTMVGRAQQIVLRTDPVASPARSTSVPAPGNPTTTLTIYNAEVACQPLRTVECGLSLFHDANIAGKTDNVVGRVYHDDHIEVICVEENGRPFIDEAGVSSYRWYRVIVPNTTEVAWISAVRTRNTIEIPHC